MADGRNGRRHVMTSTLTNLSGRGGGPSIRIAPKLKNPAVIRDTDRAVINLRDRNSSGHDAFDLIRSLLDGVRLVPDVGQLRIEN